MEFLDNPGINIPLFLYFQQSLEKILVPKQLNSCPVSKGFFRMRILQML